MLIFKRKPKVFPDNDIISCIYVMYSNNILFLKYSQAKNESNIGKWTIVSGKNEESENEIQCALRELKEETGIEAQEKDLIPVGTYYYKGNVNRKVYDFLLKVLNKPNIRLSSEHSEYKWVNIKDIKRLELVRGREEIINKSKLDWIKNYSED